MWLYCGVCIYIYFLSEQCFVVSVNEVLMLIMYQVALLIYIFNIFLFLVTKRLISDSISIHWWYNTNEVCEEMWQLICDLNAVWDQTKDTGGASIGWSVSRWMYSDPLIPRCVKAWNISNTFWMLSPVYTQNKSEKTEIANFTEIFNPLSQYMLESPLEAITAVSLSWVSFLQIL
jgi:hypothetical protein